jgi:molybdopterin-dependent oxidoreductase-like protein protein
MKFSSVRFVNTTILGAMIVLGLTGIYGLFWAKPGWVFDLHRVVAWLLVAALPWKAAISWRSLRRGLRADVNRGWMVVLSILLSAAVLLVMVLAFAWQWRLGPEAYLRRTLISWHWLIALGLLLPFLVHAWWRWPRPKKADFVSRRAALKLLGVGAATLAGWWLADTLARVEQDVRSPRRFTGSRLGGDHSGNDFPITHEVAADRSQTDARIWRLELTGALGRPLTFTNDELLAQPAYELDATIDCTLGWYAVQTWRGIPLKTLLAAAGADPAAAWVKFRSVTGYEHVLPMAEARGVLLATHVSGEPLSHAHGAPLRAVVPTRRGWFWVKWLARIEVT